MTTRRPATPPTSDDARTIAVYCRISRDNTGEALGVDRQEEACRALADRRGWTVAEVFTNNNLSATSGRARPAYSRMMTRVRAGEFDTVVCVDLDRLLRRPVELEALIDLADRQKFTAVTVSGDLDLTTTDGLLHARIRAAVAADEVRRKGDRQKRSELQARDMGRPPRRRSFGYRPGGMELDPVEAPLVAAAYADVLAGAGLAAIARQWNAAGQRTASAGRRTTGGGDGAEGAAERAELRAPRPLRGRAGRHRHVAAHRGPGHVRPGGRAGKTRPDDVGRVDTTSGWGPGCSAAGCAGPTCGVRPGGRPGVPACITAGRPST